MNAIGIALAVTIMIVGVVGIAFHLLAKDAISPLMRKWAGRIFSASIYAILFLGWVSGIYETWSDLRRVLGAMSSATPSDMPLLIEQAHRAESRIGIYLAVLAVVLFFTCGLAAWKALKGDIDLNVESFENDTSRAPQLKGGAQ